MAGIRVEMNTIESFCFYLKHLWHSDASQRVKFRILDTLIYQDGRPHTWLFTSQKTGEIMRKKAERLQHISDIVTSFKAKSHAFKGYKTTDLRTKIGIVWFLRSESDLSSYLVDEMELGRILNSSLPEIVAIQVYIGGYYAKGNGIFAHKVWRLRNGSVKHQSYENTDSMIESNLSQFSAYSKQLVVQEFQANIMTSFAQTICRHIEYAGNANLEFVHFQVVFDSAWQPYLVAVRDIIFMDASPEFDEDRHQMIYLNGKKPSMPPLHENSLMLPVRIADYTLPGDGTQLVTNSMYSTQVNRSEDTQPAVLDDESNAQSTGDKKKSKWGILKGVAAMNSFKKSGKKEETTPQKSRPQVTSMQYKHGNHTMNIPAPDLHKGPSYFNNNQLYHQHLPQSMHAGSSSANQHQTLNNTQDNTNTLTATSATSNAIPDFQPNPEKTNKAKSASESVHLSKFVDNPMSTGNLVVQDFEYRVDKKNRPQSATAVMQTQSIAQKSVDSYSYNEGGDLDMFDRTNGFQEEQKRVPNPNTGVKYGTQRYHLSTELQKIRDDHEEEEHSQVGGEKTLLRHLTVRRPISAPHQSRKKFEGLAANRRSVVSLVRNSTSGKLSKTNMRTSRLFDPENDEGVNPWSGSGLWKDNPICGVTCFGDYCWFYENAVSFRVQIRLISNNNIKTFLF